MVTALPRIETLSQQRRAAQRSAMRAYRAARRGGMQEKILKEPSLIIIDLFCGAGGTTSGFHLSGVAKVVACVNHDHNAIISHWANYPSVRHFEEDMRTLALDKLVEVLNRARALHPKAKIVLWASLECTNFSRAKGGMARDADSRTLADHLHRYITALNPDYVMIENVVEFREWGPLKIKPKKKHADRWDLTIIKQKKVERVEKRLKNGKVKFVKKVTVTDAYGWEPIKELKGIDFERWCKEVCAHGYKMEWREMNSADFGAYTSRNRLFGMFARPELNMVWPEKTHSKKGVDEKEWAKAYKKGVVKLHKWNAVKEVLDFEDEGYSILHRSLNEAIPAGQQRKDLVEATLERIYMGCIKHIAGGKKKFEDRLKSASSEVYRTGNNSFIKKYYGGRADSRTTSMDDPLSVIPTENRHALVNAVSAEAFLSKYFSGDPYNMNISVDGPAGTVKCSDGQALVQTTSAEHFLSAYYGNGDNTHSIDNPCSTLRCKDGHAMLTLVRDKCTKVRPVFLSRDFSGGGTDSSLDMPAGSLLAVPKMNPVFASFIDSTQYGNTPASTDEPHVVITANRKWPYLCNLSWGGSLHSSDKPSPVIVAVQNKSPMYLVVTEHGELAIEIYEDDSPFTKKLKEFMALYGIVDIKMRMLKVPELLQIQGFPPQYRLAGSQADQKKFIGNSVVPHVVKAWAIAMHQDLREQPLKMAA